MKILGIDVGGSKIASGIFTNDIFPKNQEVAPTSQIDLIRQLRELIRKAGNFDAIGLAVPGPVLADGNVVRLPNVPHFQPTNLKLLFAEEFKVPVFVVNDAKAFAFAEAVAGQAQNNDVVAGVILGTGIGVGLVMNKKIYFGKDGVAGELEHITLLDGDMFRNKRNQAGAFKDARAARPFLKTLFDIIVLSFNPDSIVLGGAWSNLPGMEELANELTTNVGDFESRTPVKVSKLQYPSLLGAALVCLEELKAK